MIIGLTGGIGSGKSIVGKLFSCYGAAVYHSDIRAKLIYDNPEVKQKVVQLLGEGAYSGTGRLNPSYVSDKIFSNTDLRTQLNAIIHPEVAKDFENYCKANKNTLIVKESALIFELGLEKTVDQVVLVVSPLEVKIERVMQRDQISKEDVLKRMESQMDDKQKEEKADFIIRNDEVSSVIEQSLSIYRKLVNV